MGTVGGLSGFAKAIPLINNARIAINVEQVRFLFNFTILKIR